MLMKNSSHEFDRLTKESSVSKKRVRVGWERDAKAIIRDGVDTLPIDDFPNLDDQNLEW
jgi:hypothetical protein